MAPAMEDKAAHARRLCEQARWRELLDFTTGWSAAQPADYRAQFYLGLAHSGQGQFSQAETAYRRALALDATDPRVWNNLAAVLYENLQRPGEAIRCIEAALKLNPAHKLGWANLATMLGRLGHFDRAMTCADQALALDPKLVEAYLHKGAAARALGKTEVVKEVCLALAAIEPEKFQRAR